MNSILKQIALASAFIISLIPSAFAEESNRNENQIGQNGIQVVVTASRGTAQDTLDVPQAIDTVTRQDYQENAFVDIDDSVRRLPNVSAAPAEATPNFWQEGFTIRGLGAQRVLTLTDGVRQAGQGVGYGGGNLSLYDSFAVENVEVLRGPASVLYGTDSFGGVVSVETRNPKRRTEFGTNGGISYTYDGSRDLNRAGAYIDFGDKDFGAVLGTSYINSGRPNLPDHEAADNGSFRSIGLWGKVDYFVTPHTKLRFLGNSDQTSDILVADSSMPLPIAIFGAPGSSQLVTSPLLFQIPSYDRSLIGTELTVDDLGGNWELFKTGLYWQRLHRKFHRETAFYPTFSPGFAGPPTFVNTSANITTSTVDTNDKVNTYEWQTQAKARFGDHALTLGFDLGYDTSKLPETEEQQVVAVAGVGALVRPATSIDRTRADASQVRFGLYSQDVWTLGNFDVIPGVRFDYQDVKDDQSSFDDNLFGVSGSLGSVYHLSQDQSIYGSLATGFRAPDLGERFQNGIVNLGAPTRIIGRNDLDSERSYSAEIGTKGRVERFKYEFATFYNVVKDYVGLRDLGVSEGFITQQYDNVGIVHLYGAEASATFRLSDCVDIYANGGRTWTKEDEKVDVPNWIFNYGTSYRLGLSSKYFTEARMYLNGRTVLKSVDHTPSAGRTPYTAGGYSTFDFLLNFDLVNSKEAGKATLVSGVRNLLDRNYQEPFFAQTQPGRNAYVGIRYEF